ncbi:uncharacterized protein LOC110866811 [Helianthus annuus]|uniref:uncharacterized protein LOC110866811 n=1 Tax=Helianthus annuus TaxID=4232 RepID=UPI000B8F7CFF|nr:uncharacterized protein LOC110866811 [Helianthus annuus]
MNFISLNINGVAAGAKGGWVKNLKFKLKVDVIGLQETHKSGLSEIELRRFWGKSSFKVVSVDSIGRSGGLALMWNPEVFKDVQILQNHRYLLVAGYFSGVEERVNILNTHAPNDARQRKVLWEEILGLINSLSGLWVLFGDFNDVRYVEERVNSRFDQGAADAFNGFISRAGLIEYNMSGVSLSCNLIDFGPIPFEFFNAWVGDPQLLKIVKDVSSSGSLGGKSDSLLVRTLKRIKEEIKRWRKQVNATELLEVKMMLSSIEDIERKATLGPLSESDRKTRMELISKINDLERIKAKNLQQKARVNWVKFGDENSSFFHSILNVNIASNRINSLSFDNIMISDPVDHKDRIRRWFKKQFSEPIRRRPKFCGAGLPIISEVNGCNSSFVALIPKQKDPLSIGDFRPISLVGSVYKILAKVLANRLKIVINDVISNTQSAFVGGRNILDSPLIISETVAWAKKKKEKLLIFKVDFEKAYDSINWKFLFHLMDLMGFPEKWICWIKGCLVSGMGSVLVNGSPTAEFKYKRGLRQGDPLSPFLFIIAMEVINLFMNRVVNLGLFKGFELPNGGPNLSHLCYADDVLFIGSWSEQNVVILSRLLRWIYLVTGLKVNYSKCKLFGIGVDDMEISRLAAKLNCEVGRFPFVYLGIPIGANMNRAKNWNPVIERLKAKLSKWKGRHLSMVGRMTLAKSVLGSLPTYYLSLFAAPKCVITKLERIRRDFIWGITDRIKKVRWVRWELLMKSKLKGGMGIGSIADFNHAMLIKWWWRFKTNPEQVCAKVVAAIHNSSIPNQFIPIINSIPGIWKGIDNMELVSEKIGISLQQNLIEKNGVWVWRNNGEEPFAVKQVRKDFELAKLQDPDAEPLFVWNKWASPKSNLLLWRVILDKIASRDGLIRRGITMVDERCPRCGLELETIDHIFFKCLWSRSIWWNVLAWIRVRYPGDIASFREFFEYVKNCPGGRIWKKIIYTIVIASVWRIWSARNLKVFEGCFIPIKMSVDLIKEDSFLWISNRANIKRPAWEDWVKFNILDLL